ncbi:MAG: butyrate kinase, partial [Muribaculaceae bacterium]|nr:butyrate kinase [Muribaculaceae bacterium]
MRIFVINPGSTSTKLALYDGADTLVWNHTLSHPADELAHFAHPTDQLEYRMKALYEAIATAGIEPEFDAVIARGGLLNPTPGGVYVVNEDIKYDLIHSRHEHACNLGAIMADELAAACGCPALIADPEVVDELMPEARITGLPQLPHISIFHALNSKAVSRRYAESIGRRYEDMNLIIVHLGGGISVGAHCHGKVIDVNNALAGDGPFSPERAGTLPADQLVDLCFSGEYSCRPLQRMLPGMGGRAAWLGTTDVAAVVAAAERGEQPHTD